MTRILGREMAIKTLDENELDQVAGGTFTGQNTFNECMCHPVPNGTGGYDWTPDDCSG